VKNKERKISILLTNRNTLDFLKLAVKSIRKNAYYKNSELIIMDDNSSDGSKEWLAKNRNKFNFSYHTHDNPNRKGIVNIVEEGIRKCSNDIIFIGHSDMYYAKNFDKHLLKYLEPKTIVCSTRIEPPLHPPEKCKIIKDFGKFANEFKEDEFNKFVEKAKLEFKGKTTDGIFAPTMLYKKDWTEYDKTFVPQSREDDMQFYTWKTMGYKFIQSWQSFVYHFTCRGSRYKDDKLFDSDEWKRSNYKNTRNFIRIWHTTPIHTETHHPIIAPDIKLTASVLLGNEQDKIYKFLEIFEPYFDEIIIANDSTDGSLMEINRYIKDTLENGPTNFDPNKIKIFNRKLNMDFAAQTNAITEKATNEWIMKIDVDELMDYRSLNNIRFIIDSVLKQNPNVEVIGIPRLNTLDGVLVNDIPRNLWTKEYLSKQEKFNPTTFKSGLKNPDYQFRIFKKNVKWVNPVHEVPEPVANNEKDKVVITHNIVLFHPKTLDKQNKQNEFYDKIQRKKTGKHIKNIVVNSVIYTFEGITKHPREEMKELKKLGYKIFIESQPFKSGIDDEMKNMYDVFDLNEPHITYINQPPIRQNKPFFSVLGNLYKQNIVAYLSFEGMIPKEWVAVLNHPNVKMVFVPSNYVKDCFIESGVRPKDKIRVIPHGINPKDIEGIEPYKFDKFTILWAGTTHNKRKGYDLAIRAFSEEFKGQDDVQLVLKVNKIYDPKQDIDREIKRYVVEGGNDNIHIIDDNLETKELYSLLKGANVLLHPHYSEGFGIFILEAMALGVPVIATGASGNMDFCDKDNCYLVGVKKELMYAPFIHPYERAKWFQPKIEDIKKHLRYIYENYDECRKKAEKQAPNIIKKWSWKNTAKLMDEAFKEL